MHIKKLEICGFKSFVDRTVIHFDEDVIGIVGPNGCGKSNIVDAIRWCIGEQSAKHLRGKAMADVIFAGSESRGPHGFAEVTLTFDNSDQDAAQSMPLEYRDWAEIAVTRRLFRDGTSEYLINKTQVRLRDVTELFLGTGVGTKAYSIVEQGRIGLIVSSRAEDRRMLIEEAAGITKYKARRRQAEQKMQATRQNLLRVGDIVSEIERSLASLKRQAAKAERYVSYRNELDDLVLHEASHKLLELHVLRQVEQTAATSLSEAERAARTKLDAQEAELEVSRQHAHACEERAETAQNDAFQADNQVRLVEAELNRLRDRLHQLDERRHTAHGEQVDLERSLEELSAERASLELALADAEREESEAKQHHEAEQAELSELATAQREAETLASDLRTRAANAASAVAAAEATLASFERRLNDIRDRRIRLSDEQERLTLSLDDQQKRVAMLQTHAQELAEGKVITADERDRLDAEMAELRTRSVAHERVLEDARSELGQHRNRLRALEEIHSRLEGVGAGVKSLLNDGDDALRGLVADRFQAPAELTQAFAGFLGDTLQHVVATDMDRAFELLDQLAANGGGRATVVPQAPPFVAGAACCPRSGEGVVGALFDLVAFAPEDEALARSLLGDTLVVESTGHARALRHEGATETLVSMDGSVLHADGRVSGGSGDAVAAGMIEQKREMAELHEVVADRSDRVSALLAEQTDLRQRTTEVGTALDRARNEAHQGELALVTAEKDLKQAEGQLSQTKARFDVVAAELNELEESERSALEEQQTAKATLDEGRSARAELEGAHSEAEASAATWREQVQAKQTRVTERKVLLAQVRERATGVRGTVERLGRSCDEMRQRIARLDRERTECAVEAGEAAARILLSRETLGENIERAQMAQRESVEARKVLEEVRAELAQREVDLKSLRTELETTFEQLRHHQMTLSKLEMEETHLLDGIRDRFRGLHLPTVMGDYHKRAPADDSHRARIQELTHLIDRMGPVNVDAVREHAEAEERYTYYTEQQGDLDRALADLDRAIAQMNRESRRLFKEAYDGINARFKVLFPKMFRGGSAELRLTNPEDMLETGIEILAQPPGKRLGNIELMSGGEKALTAVSLIFAIFSFKPSPFCILDEVDAPLDEANVTRYNEAIRSMTERSQFILITHIKRTMQSVDVLYGVTMQEPGVSRLVSVRVNERDARSKRRQPAAEAEAAAVA